MHGRGHGGGVTFDLRMIRAGLCGVLVALHMISLPDVTFSDQAPQPHCQACLSSLS